MNTTRPALFQLVAFFLSIILFSGCVDARRVRSLENELEREIRDLRTVQAGHSASLSAVQEDMRQLSGQIEELQHLSKGKALEFEKTLQQIGSRVPPPSGVPAKLLEADQEKISQVRGEAAELFKGSLNQIRSGDFAAAKTSLTGFIQSNPGTAFTDNAMFWLGITNMKEGEYDRAIVSFTDVFQTYPAEDMVPASLYYLAEVFEKTGAKEDSALTLEKLIDEHPTTSFAERARTKIKTLR